MPIFRLEGDDISNAELVIAQETELELESHLEDWLENSPWALAQEPILWIGRQTSAADEEGTIFPDLLGVDIEGNLVVVELKRDEAPREVVAQLLEYAAWANELSDKQIQQFAEEYFETHDRFKGKQFYDVFKDAFEVADTDEVPPLNRNLRLYIVAGNVPARVARVCRFLRTSQGMDINCIDVATFQTEAGERLVSMDVKVGDEEISLSRNQRMTTSRLPRLSRQAERQIIWEAVKELTEAKTNIEFDLKDVKDSVFRKNSNINPNTVMGILVSDTVNNDQAFPSSGENKYWRVGKGKYRLYDPEKDKIENTIDSVQD